jgi:hypothetical protein
MWRTALQTLCSVVRPSYGRRATTKDGAAPTRINLRGNVLPRWIEAAASKISFNASSSMVFADRRARTAAAAVFNNYEVAKAAVGSLKRRLNPHSHGRCRPSAH